MSSSNSDSGMEEQVLEDEECTCWHSFIKLRPFTRQNVLHYYLPMAGTACYTALSVHIVKPSLLRRAISNDPTNIFLTGSLAGSCLYIYDRKHVKSLLGRQRIGFSVFSSGLFNLGSLLLWAMIRAATAKREAPVQVIRVGLAVGSAVLLVKTGIDYMQAIDEQIPRAEKPSLSTAGGATRS